MSVKKIFAAIAAASMLVTITPAIGIFNPTTAMARDGFFGGGNAPEHEGEYDSKGLYIENGVLIEADCGLTHIVIPEGVTKIASGALQFSGIKSISIPASVIEMNSYSFDGCRKLERIYLDPNNPSFVLDNGVLYNKNKTKLICYPSKKTGTSYTVPNGVTDIGIAFQNCVNLKKINLPKTVKSTAGGSFCSGGAFSGCTNLESLVIPDGVTTIDIRTFFGCSSLTELTIPASVQEINMYANDACPNLKTIIGYAGSCAETFAVDEGLEFKDLNAPDNSAKKYAVNLTREGIRKFYSDYTYIRCNKTTAAEGETVTITLFDYYTSYELKSLVITDKSGNEIPLADEAASNTYNDVKYTFTMPAGEVDIKAVFVSKYPLYNSITVTSEEDGGAELLPGTASAQTDKYYADPGEIVTVTINDHLFYKFKELVITDEDGKTLPLSVTDNHNGTYSFAMPDGDINIKAVFEFSGMGGGPFYGENCIGIICMDEDGTELMPETVLAELDKDIAWAYEKVTVKIKENSSYDFVKLLFVTNWFENTELDLDVTNNHDGTYSFVMPDCDVCIGAIFAEAGNGGDPDYYTITKSPVTNGTVTFTVNGKTTDKASAGDTVKIVPTANSGYTVGTVTVRDAEGMRVTVGSGRTFVMPDSDVVVRVTFKKSSSGSSSSGSGKTEITDNDIISEIGSSSEGSTVKFDSITSVSREVLDSALLNKVKLEIRIDATFIWNIDPYKIPASNTGMELSVFEDKPDPNVVSRIEKSAGTVNKAEMCFSTNILDAKDGATLTVATSARPTESSPEFANLYKTTEDGVLEFVTAAPIDADGRTTLLTGDAADYTLITSTETKKPGDINNDCTVNMSDITVMLRKYVSSTHLSRATDFKMDYNNDGQCNMSDITALLRAYVDDKV